MPYISQHCTQRFYYGSSIAYNWNKTLKKKPEYPVIMQKETISTSLSIYLTNQQKQISFYYNFRTLTEFHRTTIGL